MLIVKWTNGQNLLEVGGAVAGSQTRKPIPNLLVLNKNKGLLVSTNEKGIFKINADVGDTLKISGQGYLPKNIAVEQSSTFVRVYLEPTSIMLDEVVINSGTTKGPDFRGLAEDYGKQNGIYFKGKPPITLLSPFNGSPVTFFYELLSKGGRRTRRLYQLAKEQTDYDKINSRFNNRVIRQLVPIEEKDLDAFKTAYWPTVEEIDKWSDYDLFQYIKASFDQFDQK